VAVPVSFPLPFRLDAPEPGEPAWWPGLRDALRRAPEPERAARLASGVLEAAREDADAPPEALVQVLYACCGVAPFLAMHLRRHPDWLPALAREDLERPRDRDTLAALRDAALRDATAGSDRDGAGEGDPDPAAAALRHLKYYELARLTARDTYDARVPLEESATTLAELSALADVLLDGALRIATRRVEARFGPGGWRDADGREQRPGFCVLGLGKLGSDELNFSSDVDLVYVQEALPAGLQVDPDGVPPAVWLTRLAQTFGSLVTETTPDGFLYRVDLELRPEGAQGELVITDEALARYYEATADTWEKAAFMKARPVAGDLELGWRTIRAVSPMIYRSSMDFSAVEGIRDLKEKVEKARGGRAEGFDLKIDSGGIRDVEFLAQAMQLLHGGRIPQLRQRSTRLTLCELVEVGLWPEEAGRELEEAYLFLRRVEHRVQMAEERQLHRVPADDEAREVLARASGFTGEDGLARFDEALEVRRSRVRGHFEGFLAGKSGSDTILDLFARGAPELVSFPTTRRMMESLARTFAREIEESPDRQLALNNLDRFVRGLGSRRFYFELLMDRPELVSRLASLFGASRFLSDVLARHPRIIEPVFDNPERLLLARDELEADLDALRRELGVDDPEDAEGRLAALRLFHHRQIVNVGLLDVAGRVTRDEVEAALSDVAEVCVADALDYARRALASRARDLPPAARDARFAVVALGKLGSREMGYGSDLDLVFLYEPAGGDAADGALAQDHFVRVAQRLISALHTETAEGSCYEIDPRMRPSGNQGSLVTSLSAFARYHERDAQTWERQALLRARPVAGDEALAQAFRDLRGEILQRPLPDDAAAEIHRIRQRMEAELAREQAGRRDFKTGRGGVLDVENVTQYLRLVHGPRHPELLQPEGTGAQLDALERLELLDAGAAARLREGWEFLRNLASRLRILENRSISDLDEERGDLDGLARRLGYRGERRAAEARKALLRDYRRHTEAIRRVYEQVFEAGGAEA